MTRPDNLMPFLIPFPVPHLPPKPAAEPPPDVAMVRTVTREDADWQRPVFKAPPLELHPEAFDVTRFAQDLRKIGLANR